MKRNEDAQQERRKAGMKIDVAIFDGLFQYEGRRPSEHARDACMIARYGIERSGL